MAIPMASINNPSIINKNFPKVTLIKIVATGTPYDISLGQSVAFIVSFFDKDRIL